MRLRVSLFCLLISFAHHCHPDGERGAEVERGWGEGEREREREREEEERSSMFRVPSALPSTLPFCTALYIISVQSTHSH